MTLNDVFQEIRVITQHLTEEGLSIQESLPLRAGNKIIWLNATDISIALKNVPYKEKYDQFNVARNFNFKLLDGALVQLMYEFDGTGRKLHSHRLAFFPSPYLEKYDEQPEAFETDYFGESGSWPGNLSSLKMDIIFKNSNL